MGTHNTESDYGNAMAGNNSPRIPVGLSLPVIILVFVIFWPLAIYLIWKRSTIKKIDENSGKALEVIGWFVAITGVFGMISTISDAENFDGNTVYLMITLLGGGIGLILVGSKIKRSARRYKRYVALISNQGITSIDELAAAVSVSYDVAVKDLQKMLNLGFFAGAYIDGTQRKIIFPGQADICNIEHNHQGDKAAVTCKGCGARNVIARNSVGKCEFCGSPISAD